MEHGKVGSANALGLFDRLVVQEGTQTRTRHRAVSSERLLQSIKRNLELILNSKKGCSLSSPDLGLEDFNDAAMGSADMCIRIAKDIKHSIETYEPRVKVESVSYQPSDINFLQIGFKLVCVIQMSNKQEKAEIDLLLDKHSSQFQVD